MVAYTHNSPRCKHSKKGYRINEIECSRDEMAQSNKSDSAPVEGQWYLEMHY